MPELPEVETIVRHLNSELAGRKLRKILIFKTGRETPEGEKFALVLKGKTLEQVSRRAKLVIWKFQGGTRLITHLKMTGKLVLIGPQYQSNKHDRMIFEFENKRLLWSDMRMFGFMRVLDETQLNAVLGAYGPEPLEMSANGLADRIFSFKRSTIKASLLDQKIVAGIGNIYADESLHIAKIHPATPAWTITLQKRLALARAIQIILKQAIKAKGTSYRDYVSGDGSKGDFQNVLNVYGRRGQLCHICRSTIERIVVNQRGTHFCPKCQPLD